MLHSFVFVFVVGSYCWAVFRFYMSLHDDLFVIGFVWLFIPASAWFSVSTLWIVVLMICVLLFF